MKYLQYLRMGAQIQMLDQGMDLRLIGTLSLTHFIELWHAVRIVYLTTYYCSTVFGPLLHLQCSMNVCTQRSLAILLAGGMEYGFPQ